MDKDKLLTEYSDNKELYNHFSTTLYALINSLLETRGVKVHSISTRTKEEVSLNNKIKKKNGKYKTLGDITDIVGIRIITYFDDDVTEIRKLIEREFEIDVPNSIDKRNCEPNEFGYKSLHMVVSLNRSRKELTEYKNYADMKAEIQIRTILQHAWAEIEHDLGYKNNIEVPREVRRTFSRIAGILETADLEFIRVRDELNQYSIGITEKILNNRENVYVDKLSLTSYILNNELIIQLEKDIIEICKVKLIYQESFIESLLKYLCYFNINTIKEIEDLLIPNIELIKYLIYKILGTRYKTLNNGISIFYLIYCIVLKSNDEQRLNKYLDYFKNNEIVSSEEEYVIQNIDMDEEDLECEIDDLNFYEFDEDTIEEHEDKLFSKKIINIYNTFSKIN